MSERSDILQYAERINASDDQRRCAPSGHLRALEAESVYIMREVVAEFHNPVMLYSIGKDSSVMLHLAMKAFWPSKPPFPLMHIATGWDFRDMLVHRDLLTKSLGLRVVVQTNTRAQEQKRTPFNTDSREWTRLM